MNNGWRFEVFDAGKVFFSHGTLTAAPALGAAPRAQMGRSDYAASPTLLNVAGRRTHSVSTEDGL